MLRNILSFFNVNRTVDVLMWTVAIALFQVAFYLPPFKLDGEQLIAALIAGPALVSICAMFAEMPNSDESWGYVLQVWLVSVGAIVFAFGGLALGFPLGGLFAGVIAVTLVLHGVVTDVIPEIRGSR